MYIITILDFESIINMALVLSGMDRYSWIGFVIPIINGVFKLLNTYSLGQLNAWWFGYKHHQNVVKKI